MTLAEAGEALKSWQTAIGSLLGFLALILGALFNFRLNRKRDAALRQEEALSVAAALYGEMLLLRNAVARLANAVAYVHREVGIRPVPVIRFDEHFVTRNALPEATLFRALAAKVGLLSPDLTLEVTQFFQRVEEARAAVPFLMDQPSRRYTHSPLIVVDPACDAVDKALPTLRKMEALLGLPPASEDIDLRAARLCQDMEETLSHQGHE